MVCPAPERRNVQSLSGPGVTRLPPTHNPRPTARMQHNPQYRPPCGLRASGVAMGVARRGASVGDSGERSGPRRTGPRRQPNPADLAQAHLFPWNPLCLEPRHCDANVAPRIGWLLPRRLHPLPLGLQLEPNARPAHRHRPLAIGGGWPGWWRCARVLPSVEETAALAAAACACALRCRWHPGRASAEGARRDRRDAGYAACARLSRWHRRRRRL